MYGCEAWALATELENRLRRTQRQMLRMIARVPRRTAAVARAQPTLHLTQAETDDQPDSSHQHDDDDTSSRDSMLPYTYYNYHLLSAARTQIKLLHRAGKNLAYRCSRYQTKYTDTCEHKIRNVM